MLGVRVEDAKLPMKSIMPCDVIIIRLLSKTPRRAHLEGPFHFHYHSAHAKLETLESYLIDIYRAECCTISELFASHPLVIHQ